MRPRPPASRAKRLLFSLLPLALTAALVEGLPRLRWGPPPPGPGLTRLSRCAIDAQGLQCPDEVHKSVPVGAHGPRPRLVLLGASTVRNTLAPGARGDFSEPLQALLPEVEVLNLGLPGLSTAGVAQLAAQLGPLQPDLVLIHTGHNDYNELVFSGAIRANYRFQVAITTILAHSWLRAALGARPTPRRRPPTPEDLLAVQGHQARDERAARDQRFAIELQAAIDAAPAPVLLSTLMRNSHFPPFGHEVDGRPDCPAQLRGWQARAHDLPTWTAAVARGCGEGPLLDWLMAQQSADPAERRQRWDRATDADAAPLRAPVRADRIIAQIADKNSVPYVDLGALEGGLQPGRWFFDPLHTGPEGARAMATALAPAVQAALQRGGR